MYFLWLISPKTLILEVEKIAFSNTNIFSMQTRRIKQFFALVCLIMSTSYVGHAQAPITDAELRMYVAANDSINSLKEALTVEIKEAVESSSLSITRYNELQRAKANPDAVANIGEAEQAEFVEIEARTDELRQQLNAVAAGAIQQTGLSISRYNEIQRIVANDPAQKARLDKVVSGHSKGWHYLLGDSLILNRPLHEVGFFVSVVYFLTNFTIK